VCVCVDLLDSRGILERACGRLPTETGHVRTLVLDVKHSVERSNHCGMQGVRRRRGCPDDERHAETQDVLEAVVAVDEIRAAVARPQRPLHSTGSGVDLSNHALGNGNKQNAACKNNQCVRHRCNKNGRNVSRNARKRHKNEPRSWVCM
jgi:hypothetical protein